MTSNLQKAPQQKRTLIQKANRTGLNFINKTNEHVGPMVGEHDMSFYNTAKNPRNSSNNLNMSQTASRMVMNMSHDGSSVNQVHHMQKVIQKLENELKDQTEKTHYLLSLRKETAMSPTPQRNISRASLSQSKITSIAKKSNHNKKMIQEMQKIMSDQFFQLNQFKEEMRSQMVQNQGITQSHKDLDFDKSVSIVRDLNASPLNSSKCIPPSIGQQPDELDESKMQEVYALRKELKKSAKQIKALQDQFQESQQAQENSQNQSQSKEKEVEKIDKQLKEFMVEYNKAIEQNKEMQEKLQTARDELKTTSEQRSNTLSQLDEAFHEQKTVCEQLKEAQVKNNQLMLEICQEKRQSLEVEAKNTEVKEQFFALQNELNQNKEAIQRKTVQVEELEKRLELKLSDYDKQQDLSVQLEQSKKVYEQKIALIEKAHLAEKNQLQLDSQAQDQLISDLKKQVQQTLDKNQELQDNNDQQLKQNQLELQNTQQQPSHDSKASEMALMTSKLKIDTLETQIKKIQDSHSQALASHKAEEQRLNTTIQSMNEAHKEALNQITVKYEAQIVQSQESTIKQTEEKQQVQADDGQELLEKELTDLRYQIDQKNELLKNAESEISLQDKQIVDLKAELEELVMKGEKLEHILWHPRTCMFYDNSSKLSSLEVLIKDTGRNLYLISKSEQIESPELEEQQELFKTKVNELTAILNNFKGSCQQNTEVVEQLIEVNTLEHQVSEAKGKHDETERTTQLKQLKAQIKLYEEASINQQKEISALKNELNLSKDTKEVDSLQIELTQAKETIDQLINQKTTFPETQEQKPEKEDQEKKQAQEHEQDVAEWQLKINQLEETFRVSKSMHEKDLADAQLLIQFYKAADELGVDKLKDYEQKFEQANFDTKKTFEAKYAQLQAKNKILTLELDEMKQADEYMCKKVVETVDSQEKIKDINQKLVDEKERYFKKYRKCLKIKFLSMIETKGLKMALEKAHSAIENLSKINQTELNQVKSDHIAEISKLKEDLENISADREDLVIKLANSAKAFSNELRRRNSLNPSAECGEKGVQTEDVIVQEIVKAEPEPVRQSFESQIFEEEKESVDGREIIERENTHIWAGNLYLVPLIFTPEPLTFNASINDHTNYITDFEIAQIKKKVSSKCCQKVTQDGSITWVEKKNYFVAESHEKITSNIPIQDTRQATQMVIKIRSENQPKGKYILQAMFPEEQLFEVYNSFGAKREKTISVQMLSETGQNQGTLDLRIYFRIRTESDSDPEEELILNSQSSRTEIPVVQWSDSNEINSISIEYQPHMSRMEPLRLMLEYAQIQFTESEKPMPQGSEPEVYPSVILNGKNLGQSAGTLRSLGLRLGFYEAKDPIKSYDQEQVIDNYLNFRTFMYQDKTREVKDQQEVDRLKQILTSLELKLNRSKFICSESISVADFCLAALYFDITLSQKPGDQALKTVFESSNLIPYFQLLQKTLQKGQEVIAAKKAAPEIPQPLPKAPKKDLSKNFDLKNAKIVISKGYQHSPERLLLEYSKIQFEEQDSEQVNVIFSDVSFDGQKEEGLDALKIIGKNLSLYDSQDQTIEYQAEILINEYAKYKNHQDDSSKTLLHGKEIIKTLSSQLVPDKIFPIENKLSIVDFCMASLWLSDNDRVFQDLYKSSPQVLVQNYFQNLLTVLNLLPQEQQQEEQKVENPIQKEYRIEYSHDLDPVKLFLTHMQAPHSASKVLNQDDQTYAQIFVNNVAQKTGRESVLDLVNEKGLSDPQEQATKDYKELIECYEQSREELRKNSKSKQSNINAFDGHKEHPVEIDEDTLIVDRVKAMLDILSNRKLNTAKFSCGDQICFADYCTASIYFKVLAKEPTLIPVFLDEYESLKPYFNTLREEFPHLIKNDE